MIFISSLIPACVKHAKTRPKGEKYENVLAFMCAVVCEVPSYCSYRKLIVQKKWERSCSNEGHSRWRILEVKKKKGSST